METIKAYTTIEQSKKLAEILPLESADMYWDYDVQKHEYYPMVMDDQFDDTCVRAWSLAALLNYLREIDFFPNIEADEHGVKMNINYYDEEEGNLLNPVHEIKVKADNFIDACCDMIIKLKG